MLQILIVDDSKIIRDTLKVELKRLGHEVVATASSAKEAIIKYKEYQPDLITMDITMPLMSGVEALKEIRAEFPDVVVVMITLHGEESIVMDSLIHGAKGYILKPITNEKIIQTLSTVFPDLETA